MSSGPNVVRCPLFNIDVSQLSAHHYLCVPCICFCPCLANILSPPLQVNDVTIHATLDHENKCCVKCCVIQFSFFTWEKSPRITSSGDTNNKSMDLSFLFLWTYIFPKCKHYKPPHILIIVRGFWDKLSFSIGFVTFEILDTISDVLFVLTKIPHKINKTCHHLVLYSV